MANLGWGLDPWGLGFFGGLLGPLSIQSAFALATRVVRVTTSAEPAATSPSGIGDALNPATWSVFRSDTGQIFTVASIDQVTSTSFDITVVELFGPASVVHNVTTTTLRKSTGELIESPYTTTFNGLISSDVANPQEQLARRKLIPRDIANPPTSPGLSSLGGTLVISPGGDYSLVSGAALVKKLIIRRLITGLGDFAHLPEYGLGVPSVKEPVNTSVLTLLRREAERQVLLEPEVLQPRVTITLDPAQGILFIRVQAKLKPTGENLDTTFQLPEVGGF